MDDTSELSSDESFDLANKIYKKIWTDRPWIFSIKAYSGTTDGSTTLTLPSDFFYISNNHNFTEITQEAMTPVLFIGPSNKEYKVVPFVDRRQYRDKDGYCWVDYVNNVIEFSVAPDSGQAVEYDYVFTPSDLTTGESPAFPSQFHDMIYHGMCVDNFVIQQSDKAKSYAEENQIMYNSYMRDLAYWNSQHVT